jgi:hypothetical protein
VTTADVVREDVLLEVMRLAAFGRGNEKSSERVSKGESAAPTRTRSNPSNDARVSSSSAAAVTGRVHSRPAGAIANESPRRRRGSVSSATSPENTAPVDKGKGRASITADHGSGAGGANHGQGNTTTNNNNNNNNNSDCDSDSDESDDSESSEPPPPVPMPRQPPAAEMTSLQSYESLVDELSDAFTTADDDDESSMPLRDPRRS